MITYLILNDTTKIMYYIYLCVNNNFTSSIKTNLFASTSLPCLLKYFSWSPLQKRYMIISPLTENLSTHVNQGALTCVYKTKITRPFARFVTTDKISDGPIDIHPGMSEPMIGQLNIQSDEQRRRSEQTLFGCHTCSTTQNKIVHI